MALVVLEYNEFEFFTIKQGQYIGDLECFYYNNFRRYTLKTKEECQLYVLNKNDIDKLQEKFSITIQSFVQDSYLRKKLIKRLYNVAWKYCEENNFVGYKKTLNNTIFLKEHKKIIKQL